MSYSGLIFKHIAHILRKRLVVLFSKLHPGGLKLNNAEKKRAESGKNLRCRFVRVGRCVSSKAAEERTRGRKNYFQSIMQIECSDRTGSSTVNLHKEVRFFFRPA